MTKPAFSEIAAKTSILLIHIVCFCIKTVEIDMHHQVVQLGLTTDLQCSGSQNFEQVAMAIPEVDMKLLKLPLNFCL